MLETNSGDREGRRVARRRAGLFAEAGRLSRALELLLERAGFPRADAEALTRRITDEEQRQLLLAEGRIESRKRFKGGPVRVVAQPDRWLLFVDESGKSFPSATEYFALGAVAMTGAEAERYRSRANELKLRFWGHDGVTLHEPYMRRHSDDFYFEGDVQRQQEFDAAVDAIIRETAFVVFGAGIRKTAFQEFLGTGMDPYLPADMYSVAIQMLLERFVDFRAVTSKERTRSKVLLEAQGPREDALHQREFADVLLNGTQWVPESAFQQWLETGVLFPRKRGSDPMELADMVSRDIYEWLESGCTGSPGRWRLFSDRIYCRADGMQGKFGVKVFPDADIRETIEEHRRQAGQSTARSEE